MSFTFEQTRFFLDDETDEASQYLRKWLRGDSHALPSMFRSMAHNAPYGEMDDRKSKVLEHILLLPAFQHMSMRRQLVYIDKIFSYHTSMLERWSPLDLLNHVVEYQGMTSFGMMVSAMEENTLGSLAYITMQIAAMDFDARFPHGQRFQLTAEEATKKMSQLHAMIRVLREDDMGFASLRDVALDMEDFSSFWTEDRPSAKEMTKKWKEEDGCVYLSLSKKRQIEGKVFGDSGMRAETDVPAATNKKFADISGLQDLFSPQGRVVKDEEIEAAWGALFGMDAHRAMIENFVTRQSVSAEALALGLQPPSSFPHFIISGPSGVGKTSLAKAALLLFKKEGIVGKTAPLGVISAPLMVGRHIGDVGTNVAEMLDAFKGGAIVLDEIDGLADVSSFGEDGLNALNAGLGNMANPPIVMMTVYEKKLHDVLTANAGLTRRFPNSVKLQAYDAHRLMQIFDHKLSCAKISCAKEAHEEVRHLVEGMYKRGVQKGHSGNAGDVVNLFDIIWLHMAERYKEASACRKTPMSEEEKRAFLGRVLPEDVPVRAEDGTWKRREKKPSSETKTRSPVRKGASLRLV